MLNRPRRLRSTPVMRELVRELRISPSALIQPLFVREGSGIKEEIPSLPGQTRYSPDTVAHGVETALEYGVKSVLLFGIPEHKDDEGSSAWQEDGVVQQSVRAIKEACPEVLVITDVCLCEYTSHGHCGVFDGHTVDNDKTLPLLAKIAVSHAQAGADMLAPSDMLDGRVGVIRAWLDQEGYDSLPIMSYAAKYSSAFYGPFKKAAGSTPKSGDRKGYQMDFHNGREALFEASLDENEGADIIMVKPALAYLDVIQAVAAQSSRPVAAYSVSGEYAMIKSAATAGLIDEYGAMCECAAGVFRAGADILITYYAKELAQAIRRGDLG